MALRTDLHLSLTNFVEPSPPEPLFASGVSGNSRFLVDQNGDPWFGVGDTAWSMSAQLDAADATLYFEDRAAKGVNFVLLNAPEAYYTNQTPFYRNVNGDDPFTGTNFQSSLNEDYWANVDHQVAEARRLGITLIICPAYLGISDADGWRVAVNAASNAQMTTYGEALAARYGAEPHLMWLAGHDKVPTATEMARYDALLEPLRLAGHLVWVGGVVNFGSSHWGNPGVNIDWDVDTVYRINLDGLEITDPQTGWGFTPARPIGFFEGVYEGERSFSNQYNNEEFIRRQMYGPFASGACYCLFGNNPIWGFEGRDMFPFSNIGSWENALDAPGSLRLAVFADLIDLLGDAWAAMVPDLTDTFLVGGEGTGAGRSSARFSETGAVAYRPHAGDATLTFDLTEFSFGSCRVRKFDPHDGSLSTIGTFDTSGSEAVGSLGTNGAGHNDWVLIFDEAP